MSYTIHLLELECFKAQELDGDELYIRLNGNKVWESHPDKMSHILDRSVSVSHFDFAEGRKLTERGWLLLPSYQPDHYVFSGNQGEAVLQLWEADSLTRDDLFGQAPIDASQASGGKISVVFQRLGAHYRLTYKVEAE